MPYLEQAIHRGPAGPALQPKQQRGLFGLGLGREEPEEEVGVVGLVDREEPREALLTL